jgi:hypothetical protein
MFMRPFLFIGAEIFILYLFLPRSEIAHAPGVLAPDKPLQRELFTASLRENNGYRITPVATFDIRTRVMAASRYRFGREADLSPVDLVLGWGAMSDGNILKQISFSQSGPRLHLVDQSFANSQGHDRIAQRQYAHESGQQ